MCRVKATASDVWRVFLSDDAHSEQRELDARCDDLRQRRRVL